MSEPVDRRMLEALVCPVTNAVLTYDGDGRPERGLASQWSSGWKANTLFDWQSKKDVPDVSSRELWKMWEQWIKNGPSHVFIV